MASPSITDLQSLVNRLTADNNRLRNLVKLYEVTFAAMKPRLALAFHDANPAEFRFFKNFQHVHMNPSG